MDTRYIDMFILFPSENVFSHKFEHEFSTNIIIIESIYTYTMYTRK